MPAIIEEDLFDAAQRVARDHSYFSPRRTGPDHWLLRRLVVCGHCRIKAYCQGKRPAAEGELRYYVCNRRRALEAGGLERACPQPSTRAEALDSLVWEHLRQALLRPQILVKGQAALSARAEQPDDELLKAQLERLERRLQSTETERRRLVDLYQMQAIDLAEFQVRHHEVLSRHRQFEQEREALLTQHQELAVNNRLSHKVESFAKRIRRGLDALDFEQRQKLVRLLIEQVQVTGPNVQIHLRIPLDEPSPDQHSPTDPSSTNPARRGASNQFRLRSLGGVHSADPGKSRTGRPDAGKFERSDRMAGGHCSCLERRSNSVRVGRQASTPPPTSPSALSSTWRIWSMHT